jgi:hypothetical protein
MAIVTGWGIQMVRLCSWRSEAGLRMVGIKRARNATTAAWRHQFGSVARTWKAVHAEATELIAVWTMCRLIEASASYLVAQGDWHVAGEDK